MFWGTLSLLMLLLLTPPPPPPLPQPPPPPWRHSSPGSELALNPAALLQCGDVHPHPGPRRFIVSNATSLRALWAEVSDWDAIVVILAETRRTPQGQGIMSGLAREAGW